MSEFTDALASFFSTGPRFVIAMLAMGIYCAVYSTNIRRAAAHDKRNQQGCQQLARYVYLILWERLRRFDFFTILYIVSTITFLTLPWFLLFHSKRLE
jgi:hypothetical protein